MRGLLGLMMVVEKVKEATLNAIVEMACGSEGSF